MAILTVLLIGASGIIAQVLLLRELLVSFYGNELTLGVILANWILAEALGVYWAARVFDRIKDRYFTLILFQIVFSLSLPVSVFLSRAFKSVAGMAAGQGLGLNAIFISSLLIIIIPGFCHGGLFSLACGIFFKNDNKESLAIGKVYYWETAGTLLGSLILTFLLIPLLNSSAIVYFVSVLNILACLLYLRSISRRNRIFLASCLAALSLFAFLIFPSSLLEKISLKWQYKGSEVLDYRNSVYGNLAMTQNSRQRTLFYNGLPAITTPYPDLVQIEEFANLPLLSHPDPQSVLIISHGLGGVLSETLKHPVKDIDCVELDPELLTMLKKFPSEIINREVSDKRVNLIFSDGRFFLKESPKQYDVILLGMSGPADLSSNRYFTGEFFSLAGSRLSRGGILAFRLPGSLTYINAALRDLDFSIINAVRSAFLNVKVIPGEINLVLASDLDELSGVSPQVLYERMAQRNINTRSLVPGYLDYRMDHKWLEWFLKSAENATKKSNRDLVPFALLPLLTLWNQQFAPAANLFFSVLSGVRLWHFLLFFVILTVLLLFLKYEKPQMGARLSVGYCIVTTGFYAMLSNLILIFSFQVAFGYLYRMIGLLIAVFMAGSASGAFYSSRSIQKRNSGLKDLMKCEALIGVFCLLLSLMLYRNNCTGTSTPVFILLFFTSGFLAGLEFPVAAEAFFSQNLQTSSLSGMVYSLDLTGGAIAGMIGAVFLLPVLGLFDSSILILFLKAGGIITLAFKKSKKIKKKVDKN